MRIAIYDDNIADRRHAERLLKRESDRVHSLGAESFVIDCFGSADRLYAMADTYDVFLIDIAEDPVENGLTIARALRGRGVRQPVVLCSGKIDYRALAEASAKKETDGNFHFLAKPYEAGPLIDILGVCEKHLVKREGRIELRTEGETVHAVSADILYAAEAGQGYLSVAVRDRGIVRIMGDAPSLYELIQSTKKDPAILPVSPKAFVNRNAVKDTGFLSITMEDGRKLRVSPAFAENLREIRQSRKS